MVDDYLQDLDFTIGALQALKYETLLRSGAW